MEILERPIFYMRFASLVTILFVTGISLFVSSYAASLNENEVVIGEAAAEARGTVVNLPPIQVLFQIPADSKAVLFIAPGCSGRASYFWDNLPHCADCKGLPEERALLLSALARHYAVIAISSEGQCSSPKLYSERVNFILADWIPSRGLEGLPVAALGVSSGGYFVSSLALQFPFQALVIMISEGNLKSIESSQIYPPTLFVHMPKDEERSLVVTKAMDLLRSKGLQTNAIECHEIPLYPLFFSERIPGLDDETSEKIYAVFRDNGWLDEQGYLKRDGRTINWQMAVKKRQVLPSGEAGKVKWEDHIQEELNLAYAYHEISSVPSEAILDWLDLKTSNPLQKE
ncbi:hypothetical protein O6H91_10G066500 [Diphasiastrum complanatum]|nr:hypothetical protein O6H91_10G066500 [Diphasiastrum complanatum]